LLFFVPNIIYDLTHNFYSTNGFSILIKQFTNNGFGSLLNLLGQRVDAFTWNFRSTFSANIVKSICLLLIMCLGTYLFIKDRKIANYQKLFLAYLVLTPITRILFLFFYPDSIRAWYLLDLVIIYCFTLGIVLGYFLKKKRLMIFSLAIIAGLMLIFMARTNELFRNEFSLSLGIGRIAQSVVVEYVFKDANRQPFNYIPLDIQKRFDFDYLFWWYGTKKYNFKPSTVQQKIRYYIFDKNDPNEERFPKDFTGNVTDTIVFPNGFIVKKVIN
jgi:hypothetical protein